MFDNTPDGIRRRTQLLDLALGAQHGISLDDPADYWYLKGTRDAYVYAAAVLAAGQPGDPARAAASRVDDLLGDGTQNIADLLAALDPTPQPEARDGLTWVGPVAFNRLTSTLAGIDHDLGTRWGAQRDVRISHRRPHDGTTGLLYAYDRTWDEYTILADDIHADIVEAARVVALDVDPHLPLDRFLHVLHDVPARHAADVAAVDAGPVLR